MHVRRVSEATVQADDVLAFADGEPVARLPLRVSAVPGVLRVLTPGVPPPRRIG